MWETLPASGLWQINDYSTTQNVHKNTAPSGEGQKGAIVTCVIRLREMTPGASHPNLKFAT